MELPALIPSRRRRSPSAGYKFNVERLHSDWNDQIQTSPVVTVDDLSPDQTEAYQAATIWLGIESGSRPFSIGGLAGTGKTTLTVCIARWLEDRRSPAVFTAFTGKAVDVLSRKLRAQDVDMPTMTLHSLLYRPRIDEKTGRVTGWEEKPFLAFDADGEERIEIVVIDEASMVGSDLWTTLQKHNVKVLLVGDHGQLPPVGKSSLNLVLDPTVRLEKIHRQAEGNPIIQLAHHIRNGGMIKDFEIDGETISMKQMVDRDVLEGLADFNNVGICGFNNTRVSGNRLVRRFLDRPDSHPVQYDAVINLKNIKPHLFNGMRGVVSHIPAAAVDQFGCVQIFVDYPDNATRVGARTNLTQFNREKTWDDLTQMHGQPHSWKAAGILMDYAYFMTCHKSQGSQFNTVYLKPETFWRWPQEDQTRWLYTAVTRAAEKLVLI